MTLQKAIESLKSVQQYYVRHPAFSELSKEELRKLKEALHMVRKSTEFINASYNDKTKIPIMTESRRLYMSATMPVGISNTNAETSNAVPTRTICSGVSMATSTWKTM